jgi:hypothetical protein
MDISELTAEFEKLWPRLDEQEYNIAQVVYWLNEKLKVRGKKTKGQGVKPWCQARGIDLNRWNYLVWKGMPDDVREKKEAERISKKKQEAVGNGGRRELKKVNNLPATFHERVWNFIMRDITSLPLSDRAAAVVEIRKALPSRLDNEILYWRMKSRPRLVPLKTESQVMPVSGISRQEVRDGDQA